MKTFFAQHDRAVFIRDYNNAGDFASEILPMRRDLREHATYFSWGGRNEAAEKQLALALACEILHDDTRAVAVHEHLAKTFLRPLPFDGGWECTDQVIRNMIADLIRTHELEPQDDAA